MMKHHEGFLVALWLAAVVTIANAEDNSANAQVLTTSEPFILTPDEVQMRVVSNALRLQDEIRSKGLEISGSVQGVEERYGLKAVRVPMVKIKTSKPALPVQAHLLPSQRSAAASLDPGQQVRIRCGDIQLSVGQVVNLHDCEIAK